MRRVLVPFQFADVAVAEDGITWIDAIEPRTYGTKRYGEVVVTDDKLSNFVRNFNEGVRTGDIAIDYDHGKDVNKGNKAAGWLKGAKIEDGKLRVGIEFTEPAKQEIKDGEWRYFSLEWENDYEDTTSGIKAKDVVIGGGLTNRPVAKGLRPINFSELSTSIKFAVWTSAYKDALPDSAFLYVNGKDRKFPVRDADGKLDIPHVRNAIARIPDADIPDDMKSKLQAKARAMLGAKQMHDMGIVDDVFLEHVYATAADEIMEPGSDAPDYEDTTPDDALEGSRIDTPFPGYDGSIVDVPATVTDALAKNPEISSWLDTIGIKLDNKPGGDPQLDLLVELRKLYGLGDDVDDAAVLKHVGEEHVKFSEIEKTANRLKDTVSFAEAYPEQAQRMQELEADNRKGKALLFSETLGSRRVTKNEGEGDNVKKVDTNLGLSALALDKLKDTHIKFSEGTATMEDLNAVVDAIFDNGVVEYGERGSTKLNEDGGANDDALPTNVTDIRALMLTKTTEAIEASKKDGGTAISFSEATAVVAQNNPKLYEAYRTAVPTG